MKKSRIAMFLMTLLLLTTNLFATVSVQQAKPILPVEVHFIDTGNSDTILIKDNDKNMLIDGAENDDEKPLVEYLKAQGIKKLDYIVLTHPDADHSGGLDAVIKNFEVGNVFIGNGSADTKTYKEFVQSTIDKKLQPSVPLEDVAFTLGNGTFKFYNTKSQAKNVNDRSLVMLYKNGEQEFLFTGDAGVEVEKAILDKMIDIDVLKVGHHGSNSSTSQAFLNKVKPEVAVITCGKDNKYGHPHKEVAERLSNITTYRTDINGNVVIKSDGVTLTINNQKVNGIVPTTQSNPTIITTTASKPTTTTPTVPVVTTPNKPVVTTPTQPTPQSKKVWVTGSGKKYHEKGCRYINNTSKELEIEFAKKQGYEACKVCH